MTKNDLTLLSEVLRASKGTHPIKCVTTWNGFEAGQTYQAEATANGAVFAHDKDGISTTISSSVCTFFELSSPLPTEEDRVADRKSNSASRLRELGPHLTAARPVFQPGQILEWIPGMCDRQLPSDNAVMYVVEQTDAVLANPRGHTSNPNDIALVDLRVACLATSSREDEAHVVEVMVDSRRVQPWGTNGQ